MGSMSRFVSVAPILLAGLVLAAACAPNPAQATKIAPATVEKMGEGLNRLTVTERASGRLGLTTARVEATTLAGAQLLAIPYSAVIYDKDGGVWAYVSQGSRAYVRQRIAVETIEGNTAYLRSGPAVGAEVVSVGAAELYGLEFGIGK